MRRILSIGFLLLIAFQLVGTWTIFQFRRSEIRREVKREIKCQLARESNLTFHFSAVQFKDLEWVKDDEFRLSGKMYDVVSQTQHADGSVELLCFSDEKETLLHERLAKALGDRLQDDPSAASSHSWTLSYVEPSELMLPLSSGDHSAFNIRDCLLEGVCPSIASPPPQLA